MIYRILTLRLHWYGVATAQLLLRRWQAILLLVGVFGSSLLVESSYLVLVLLDKQHGMFWRFGIIGLWQACWVLWVLMQLNQLRGGRFRDFAQSLPLSTQHWRTIDLLVLLVSDTPLFLPFVAVTFTLAGGPNPSVDALTGGLLIFFMVSTQLACQLAVVGGRARNLISIVFVNLWVASALGLQGPTRSGMLLMAAIVGLWTLLSPMPALSPRLDALLKPVQGVWLLLTRLAVSWLPPLTRLSFGILYRQHRSSMLGKLLYCLLVFVTAESLMKIWQYDGRSVPMALIAAGLVALSSSGLFRHLKMSHESALPFTATLPMPRRWALPGDSLAVLSFGYPFVLAIAYTLWDHVGLTVFRTTGFVASFTLLVLLLRLPQLFSNRNAVLLSSLIAALWSFGAANIF